MIHKDALKFDIYAVFIGVLFGKPWWSARKLAACCAELEKPEKSTKEIKK